MRADLARQLADLGRAHDIRMEGVSLLSGLPERPGLAPTRSSLRGALSAFNHLILLDAGRVKRVVITSRKSAAPAVAASASVPVRRVGAHHVVSATLTGPNRAGRRLDLLIDTGATMVVLPESLAPELGFLSRDLQSATVKTANGPAPAMIGELDALRIGQVVERALPVAFLPDERLGGTLLLGMSFLGKFKMTIDDAKSVLLLVRN